MLLSQLHDARQFRLTSFNIALNLFILYVLNMEVLSDTYPWRLSPSPSHVTRLNGHTFSQQVERS